MAGLLKALALCLLFVVGAKADAQECTKKVDILIVVDASGSIDESDYDTLKEKIAEFVVLPFDDLEVNFAFIQYGSFVTGVLSFQDELDDALVARYFLYYEGQQSYLNRALEEARLYFKTNRGARPDSLKYLVLYSDGQSTNHALAVEEAENLKDIDGVKIIGVGVGNDVSMDGVGELTSDGLYFDASDLSTMADVSEGIVGLITDFAEELCTVCSSKVDVVVIVDSSGSVVEDDYDTLKVKIANMASGPFGGLDAQYSFINAKFDSQSISYFNFMVDAPIVAQYFMFYEGQQTYIASALNLVPDHFLINTGHRSDAFKVAILFSDGVNSEVDGGQSAAEAAAQALKDDDIYVFTVGIGNFSPDNLEALASTGLFFDGSDLENLDSVTDQMSDQMVVAAQESCDEAPCVEPTEADVLFIIDSSASIGESLFNTIKDKTADYLSGGNMGGMDTKYAFITFSTFPALGSKFDSALPADLVARFVLLYGGQQSYINKPFMYVGDIFSEDAGHRPNAMKIIILITDAGITTPPGALPEAVTYAQELMNDGYHIFGIGVGPDQDMARLRTLVNDEAFPVDDVENELIPTFNRISSNLENQVATHCEDPCPVGVDIVVVIDTSASQTEDQFDTLISQYLPGLFTTLDNIDLSVTYSFVGCSSFSMIWFDFRFFVDVPFFTPQLASSMISYEGQQSKMGNAMHLARTCLTEERGSRPKALKYVLVFSDHHFTPPINDDLAPEPIIMELENEGVTVVNFGYGPDVNIDYLDTRAENSGYVFNGQDLSTMPGHFQTFANMIETRVAGLCED